MRYGKRLALQLMDDRSGAPYLSLKPMKETINRTVRELRLFLAQSQGCGAAFLHCNSFDDAPSTAEMDELEERVLYLDHQLFSLIDDDLARILAHVRAGEMQWSCHVAKLQGAAKEAGLLIDESHILQMERTLPHAPGDRGALCRNLLALRIHSDPVGTARQVHVLSEKYKRLVQIADQHLQYMEINVMGFRKLLKRYEKQIPQRFRSRPMPFLRFHGLVTRKSRRLMEVTWQLGEVLGDAWTRLSVASSGGHLSEPNTSWETVARLCCQQAALPKPRGLGPECEMVLRFQKQLHMPMSCHMIQCPYSPNGPSPQTWFEKPEHLPNGHCLLRTGFLMTSQRT